MTKEELLFNQYKMIEDRRTYFGKLFWQVPTFFIVMLTIFFDKIIMLKDTEKTGYFCLAGGIISLMLFYIAYRLAQSQNECEKLLAKIEKRVKRTEPLFDSLPVSSKFGARFIVLTFLYLLSTIFFVGFVYIFTMCGFILSIILTTTVMYTIYRLLILRRKKKNN